jgi:hypothetical protein
MLTPPEALMANKDTFRIVTRGSDGSLLIRDYPNCDPISQMHLQVGTDDCSTDLAIRGMPVFRGLIGPIPEGKNIVRYESPEVFETLTKEWINKTPKRRRRRTSKSETANEAVSTGESMASADRVDDASIANTGIAANSMIANGLIDNELSMN